MICLGVIYIYIYNYYPVLWWLSQSTIVGIPSYLLTSQYDGMMECVEDGLLGSFSSGESPDLKCFDVSFWFSHVQERIITLDNYRFLRFRCSVRDFTIVFKTTHFEDSVINICLEESLPWQGTLWLGLKQISRLLIRLLSYWGIHIDNQQSSYEWRIKPLLLGGTHLCLIHGKIQEIVPNQVMVYACPRAASTGARLHNSPCFHCCKYHPLVN